MSLTILSLSVLVVLSNFVLENVEGQPKDSSTVFQALENLTKAVERLEAKIQLQTTSINNIEAKVEIQDAKIDVQATILMDLRAELVKVQNNSLNNFQVTATAMQKNFLNIFEEKFSLLSNLVNNSMAEDQKQVTSLKSLDTKVDAQGALLTNLTTNVNMQAQMLSNLDAASKLHKNSINNLESTTAELKTLLCDLETKADMQATSLNKLVAEVEWHEPVAHFKSDRTIVAFIGDDVEMWCVVRGTPLPEIKWTRDNGTLSDRVVVENNGKVLRIKNFQLSDESVYVCAAANGVGNPVSQVVRLAVYGKFRQCHRMIESDKGHLEIDPSDSSCLCVIKLKNTTGFRIELDPLLTGSILVIPEQNSSNSNAQSIWIHGSKNASSYEFEGKKLAIVVPPGRERTTFNWRGLSAKFSEIQSTSKFVNHSEGMLEWEAMRNGSGKIFWEFSLEMPAELNWTLNTNFTAEDQESPCENMFFSIFQIKPDGNISEIERTCDGSSEGSFTLEGSSQNFVLLHTKSTEAARSKLRVSWIHHVEPLTKMVDGVVAGTEGGAFVVPFYSEQTKAVTSGFICGLTFDWNSQKIYYLKEKVGLIRSNLDGSESKTLLADSSSSLRGLTIEPTTGNFYYGDQTNRTIRVCNKDANKCSTIANSSYLDDVWDVAVHRSKGLLFWSIYHQKLVRANLDGSNATVILQGHRVRGIDVDEHADRLYWGSKSGIGSSDLNGQSIQMLPSVSIEVMDVAIDNDRVYYADWHGINIHFISKSGTNQRMVAQLTDYIRHIALFGTQVSNQPANPCNESKCAHLCILVTRWSYRCVCPDNQKLNIDGKTCTF